MKRNERGLKPNTIKLRTQTSKDHGIVLVLRQ